MAVRIQFRRGTAAEWTSANPVLAAGELGYETDTTQIKIGTGSTTWENLAYSAVSSSYIDNAIANVIDMAPGALDTLNELAAALNDDNNFFSTVSNNLTNAVSNHANVTTNVHGISNTYELVYKGELAPYATTNTTNAISNNIGTITENINTISNNVSTLTGSVNNVSNAVTSLQGDINNINNSIGNIEISVTNVETDVSALDNRISDAENTLGNVTSTEISYLANVTSNIQSQINTKAPSNDPSFTGNVTLPSTTSIGNVSDIEISYLNNVSSAIQTQLDAKLATASAASIYAPLSDPTFISSVTLPANTTIGTVSSTEIGYLDNVSSNIQTQLNSKAPTANPTFTGTVSGITASMVGLGNVDNTSDANKPISTATQSALDLKAPLANASFTGTISLPATTSIGDVSATEIGYLNNVSSAIQTQLDGKQATITGGASSITSSDLTASRALIANASGKVVVSSVTDTELGYVSGVTSGIQTQLNAKLNLAGGTMTGALTLSGDPTQALHAVTKQYVDNISAGLHVHEAVHVATDNTLANLCGSTVTYNNGTDGVGATLTLGASLSTIDGHTLTNGDRILVKNEATTSRNGIYVRTSATVLTRATDFDTAAEIAGGDFVFVENGTLYNSTGWVCENEVNTVGTDAITWLQFAGAGTITAGNNISVSGLQVSVANSPSFTGTVTLPATTSIGPVSATEIGYLDNVTSNIQTQLDGKQATITGGATSITSSNLTASRAVVSDGSGKVAVSAVTSTELGHVAGVTSAIQTQINAKANTASPTFTGLVTVAANGIAFTDGTQTKQGVPSITVITPRTASYTLASLDERDTIIEISNASATTLTVPADSTLNFPVGTTLDIIQTGAGQVTIANAVGVTINATPGLKLRTQWSSATLLKRAANTWLAFGDLSA